MLSFRGLPIDIGEVFFFNRSDFGMKATFILDRKRQHFGMDSHNWKHLATLPLDRPGHRLAKGGRVPVFRLKMKRRNSCYTNLLNLRMRCKGYASFWQNVAGPNKSNWRGMDICKMTRFPPNVWIRAVAKLVADDVLVFSLDTSGVWIRGCHHENYSWKTNMPPENQPIPSMYGIFTYRTRRIRSFSGGLVLTTKTQWAYCQWYTISDHVMVFHQQP